MFLYTKISIAFHSIIIKSQEMHLHILHSDNLKSSLKTTHKNHYVSQFCQNTYSKVLWYYQTINIVLHSFQN